MNPKAIGGVAVAAAIVAGVILALQNFNAADVACPDIAAARTNLQAMYDTGVNASVQVYAEERAAAEDALSRCINARPTDPCEDLQAARDAAVKGFNDIASPKEDAPYAEWQVYFKKRDDAYNTYKAAKAALEACRAANPPKEPVEYEKSDTKKCFDAYDASIASMRDTFEENTQAMRTALKAAQAALDAREKACNPPTGNESFTDPPREGEETEDGGSTTPMEIAKCQMLDPNLDSELLRLRAQAATLPAQIQAVQDSIKNINDRMNPLRRDLADVDTYIPPEATKTQFEGALNALRAQRKVAIESDLEFYQNMLTRKQAEKAALEKELSDLNAQIAARLAQIQKENEARQRAYPTSLRNVEPHGGRCEYYHCHGVLCGKQDPAPDACGHGSTTQGDTGCQEFFKSYLKAAGM